MQIAQSVVVITAAGSAIGRAMAMHFSQLGAHIALIDTDASHLQTTLERCQTLKNPCHGYLIKDLTEANIHQIGLKVLQDFGSIDILVNCWQGIVLPNLLSSHSEEHMTQALTQDSTLFFSFGRFIANYMKSNKRAGVILNVITSETLDTTNYTIGNKAMIAGLTQNWAKELKHFDVRVGSIVPISYQETNTSAPLSLSMQYEMVRSAEYIVENDYFNGRIIEAEHQ
ncbi:SDR family oxidoreductase [Photobacterium damselae]|uniref:SDR family oxidoreductase n=1 Tax=Photobacterium damselae TaxID=38293 RepID=UPI000E2A97B5|nr:SDR family oxidoreductase [Photobacterium damselae]RDL31726.1 hypothetical protein BC461_08255 [Photobacterium damselae]